MSSTVWLNHLKTETMPKLKRRIKDLLIGWAAPRQKDNEILPACLSELEARLEAHRSSSLSEGSRPARIRPLPYPFEHYLTITSDCDTPNMDAFLNVGREIRENYGLPVSDSYFPKWIYRRGFTLTAEVGKTKEAFSQEVFFANNARWVLAFHKGWFDVVHGWATRLSVKIADDLLLGKKKKSHWLVSKFGKSRVRIKTLKFRVPPGWQGKEPPRYLTFQMNMPHSGSFFLLHGYRGRQKLFTLDSHSIKRGSAFRASSYIVDLHPLAGTGPDVLHNLHFVFQLMGSSDGFLEIKSPCLMSDIRADILRQKNAMEQFNIGSTVFTSHGGGMYLGLRHVNSPDAWDTRCLAEDPRNAHYCMDILREHQIQFFNTHNNTTLWEPQDISNLVFANGLSDGTLIYDFNRYQFIPRDGSDGFDAKTYKVNGRNFLPSYVDFMGMQIRGALKSLKSYGQGAMIYTHNVVKDRTNKDWADIEGAFNAETHSALKTLADRFYDLDGPLPDKKRVFVAPTSVLLRLSQVLKEIGHHSAYHPAENSLYVDSWPDPVTGKNIPDPQYGVRDLRGVTFYVEEAHSARLFVDQSEIFDLIRNPADQTGFESVTVADTRTAHPVIGRIPLSLTGMAPNLKNITLPEKADCFPFPKSRTRLVLQSRQGSMGLYPKGLTLANFQGLAFKFRKSATGMSYRIDISTEDGMRLSFCESIFAENGNAWQLPPWNSQAGRLVILPFHLILSALPPEMRHIPVAAVKQIDLHLTGEEGNAFDIEYLRFLRDNEGPSYHEGYLVGGSVESQLSLSSVWMEYAGRIYKALFTDKYFIFPKKTAKSSVVRLWAETFSGEIVTPLAGPFVEVLSNDMSTRF